MATFTGQQEQQWDNVVFHKAGMKRPGQSKNQHLNSQRRAGNVIATKKMGRSNNSAVRASDRVGGEANMCKLETDNESLKHAKVGHELRSAIQQARTAKGLTQKELATQLNVKTTMISDYEAGRAIPNPQFIVKLERKLGVKLPRSKKKKVATAEKTGGTAGAASGRALIGGVVKRKKTPGSKKGPVDLMKGLRISR